MGALALAKPSTTFLPGLEIPWSDKDFWETGVICILHSPDFSPLVSLYNVLFVIRMVRTKTENSFHVQWSMSNFNWGILVVIIFQLCSARKYIVTAWNINRDIISFSVLGIVVECVWLNTYWFTSKTELYCFVSPRQSSVANSEASFLNFDKVCKHFGKSSLFAF